MYASQGIYIFFLLVFTGIFFWKRNYYQRANRILKEKADEASFQLQQLNDTLEKKVEERTHDIQQAEIKFRTLVEASLVGVYIVQDKKFIYANPTFEQLLGYNKGELIGTEAALIIPDEEREKANEQIRKRISGEADHVHYEITGLKKNGDKRQLEFYGSKTIYEGRSTLIGTMLDITERKKMEQGLREAETKFRDLVEKSLVGVYIIVSGKFAYVNPRFAQIFGRTQRELTDADSVDIVVYEPDRPVVTNNIQQRMLGEVEGIHWNRYLYRTVWTYYSVRRQACYYRHTYRYHGKESC